MPAREVRVPIAQKQFQLITDLQKAARDIESQAVMAINTILAGQDEALGKVALKGLEVKDGVYAIVLNEEVSEAPKAPRKSRAAE